MDEGGESPKPVAMTLFNVDVTSFLLNKGGAEMVYVTPEALEELSRKNLSPTITGTTQQRRGCSLMTLISAAGTLDAAVVMIRDEVVKAHELLQASDVPKPSI
jgi:hypothetical protein